jgi:hypothetical protein
MELCFLAARVLKFVAVDLLVWSRLCDFGLDFAGVAYGIGGESLGIADCQDYPMFESPVSCSIASF